MNKEQILQKLNLVKCTIESVTQHFDIACAAKTLTEVIAAIQMSRFTSGTDLTGQTFGQLIVLGIHSKIKWSNKCGYSYSWMCRCSCGHIVYKSTQELLHHKGRLPLMCSSCMARLTNTKHGSSNSKLYGIWSGMKQRCYDKNHPGYKRCGFKGIIVCDEWVNDYSEFEEWAFTHGYKEGVRLTRRNKNDNFSPENCYFEGNRLITIGEESHTILQWCKLKDVDYQAVTYRIKHGLPQELWFYKGKITNKTKECLLKTNDKNKLKQLHDE